jgi:hypothetical protein
VGNGALVFVVSAFTLWLIARGYGKNFGSAWNTLTGASAGDFSPGGATGGYGGASGSWGGSTPQQGPPIPTGAGRPGTPMTSYAPEPIPYQGYSIA